LVLLLGTVAQSAEPGPPSNTGSTDDARVLAKRLQNPIGDRYSFLFPNNTNFNAALNKGTPQGLRTKSL
jgi:hypothetical protein